MAALGTQANRRPDDFRALARSISLVENEAIGYEQILENLKGSSTPVIGITGPPGAGKSTVTDALIEIAVAEGKKVGVLCVDPSSPFHRGALLGDRIRMGRWYTHPGVFIRSLASKGSLGGLHPKMLEITDLMRGAGFDLVIIETVGVGQSEVDIAALADLTIVLLVPEGGDTIQVMKAGLMEIADIFVVNKYDRPGAASFFQNLQQVVSVAADPEVKKIPILKMIATQGEGVLELYNWIGKGAPGMTEQRKLDWMTEKAWALIQEKRMKGMDRNELRAALQSSFTSKDFNLYRFASRYDRTDLHGED